MNEHKCNNIYARQNGIDYDIDVNIPQDKSACFFDYILTTKKCEEGLLQIECSSKM